MYRMSRRMHTLFMEMIITNLSRWMSKRICRPIWRQVFKDSINVLDPRNYPFIAFLPHRPKMPTLLVECANILNCSVKELTDKITHTDSREILLKKLKGRQCRTKFTESHGNKKIIIIEDFTIQTSDVLPAYGKLAQPYNVTVVQHFFSRQRIRLENPYLPCVIEKFWPYSKKYYYPLELLELIDEEVEECKCAKILDSFERKNEKDEESQAFCHFCTQYR